MEPESLLVAKISNGIHVVDRTGIDGPCCRYHAEWNHAGLPVGADLRPEFIEVNRVIVIDRHLA